ncbi:MAG: alpha/beta fold hydrolase [Syntrophomonadaceae bacterium]|jgi:putative redox protein|nr:alpha/beta fold hydrolase [Syntrophomonadaceae bacterium]
MEPLATYVYNRAGQRLAALLFPARGEVRCGLAVAHGFRGGKENSGRIVQLAEAVAPLGCLVLAFDFTGVGGSEGDYSRLTLTRQADDVAAVVDHLAQRCPRVVTLGRSLGGSSVLLEAARDARVSGVVLWSTPLHLPQTFARIMPEAYQRMAAGEPARIRDENGEFELCPDFVRDLEQHRLSDCVRSLQHRPLLIIHGAEDEVVPVSHAREIAALAGAGAELHVVDGCDHRFTACPGVREAITAGWLRRLLGLPLPGAGEG